MLQIRPVSDLHNSFSEIEKIVNNGDPVYLTKNGYGTMVVMNIDKYSQLALSTEIKLDEADAAAANSDIRYTHEEVFSRLRN